jgi:hypothetical protein
MDIEVAGKSKVAWDGKSTAVAGAVETPGRIVATADAFQKAQGVPSAVVFPVETDAQGKLVIRVRPHPGAPDQNPVVCGLLLFPADAKLDADAIIHQRGPKPFASLLATDFRADAPVEGISIVYKQHYDMGFRGQCADGVNRSVTAKKLIETFRSFHLDQALDAREKTKDKPPGQRFVWTVPGFLANSHCRCRRRPT